MEPERLIVALRERIGLLEQERVATVERLNCIIGGIAELEYLLQNLLAEVAECPESSLPTS